MFIQDRISTSNSLDDKPIQINSISETIDYWVLTQWHSNSLRHNEVNKRFSSTEKVHVQWVNIFLVLRIVDDILE